MVTASGAAARAALPRAWPAATSAPPGMPGIGRRAAQQLARRELSKPIYHPSSPLIDRALAAIARWLGRLFNSAGAVPGGWWALIALAALLVIVTAVVMTWVGPVARTMRGRDPLAPSGASHAARDHRASAERLAEAGDFAGAIVERLRAVAAELDERGLLPSRPGWTAHEFAREAGRLLPGQAGALRDGAALFDEVCYGKRPGAAEGYERLRELDDAVRQAAGRMRAGGEPRAAAGVGGRP